MLDGIPYLGDIGATAVLVIFVLAILTGRLVPRKTYEDKQKEADQWRESFLVEQEARGKLDVQNGQLLELAKTTDHFIRSLPRPTPTALGQPEG